MRARQAACAGTAVGVGRSGTATGPTPVVGRARLDVETTEQVVAAVLSEPHRQPSDGQSGDGALITGG
jgi:hypothetical protein